MVSSVATEAIKIYGPPTGAAGVRVIETIGSGQLGQPSYGAVAMFMVAKRGPSGVPVPITSRKQYDTIFGDPGDPRWHLYADASNVGPDAVDGFFTMAGGAGMLWITRLDLEGKGKRSTFSLKNRLGTEVLQLTAANEGRWAGYTRHIPLTTLIVATSRTFTIYLPNTGANELVGAIAQFSSGSGKQYQVIANTESADTGEVIFTISSQYDLIADGVNGPVTISGTANYSRYNTLAGTIAFPLTQNLTGTATINNTVVTGVGTAFMTELAVGRNIYYQGEARVIESISSNTTLTIDSDFTANAAGVVMQRDNLMVMGTGTDFTQLNPGDHLYVTVNGQMYQRTVATVVNATQVNLASGFPIAVPAGTQASVDNFWVIGTGTHFDTELVVGNSIIDPNRDGSSVTVMQIDGPGQRFKVNTQFALDFTGAQLTKQSQGVLLDLVTPIGQGLAVQVGLGTKYPATHFSLLVTFNGSLVLKIPDASLDPSDKYFVEPLVNDGNIAHRAGGKNYQTWVTCESMWSSAYTTAPTNDVRPCNGSGEVLAVTGRRIYTVGMFDYTSAINSLLYPNPYQMARQTLRIKNAVAPVALQGTISTIGVTVNGTNTNFLSVFATGDYLYDPKSDTVRMVRVINSDQQMILQTMFPADLLAGTQAIKAGYLQMDQGIDMTKISKVGDRFLVSFAEYFAGGYDGDTATLIPYHFTKFFNIDEDILGRAIYGKNLGLVRMLCPGISETSVQAQGGNYASQIACEYRVEFPPNITDAAGAEAFINIDLGRDDFFSAAFPSQGLITSPLSNSKTKRLISINGDICGLESYYANLHAGYHWPTAGVDAALTRVSELLVDISPQDQAVLNSAGIQPVLKMFGRTILFGAEVPGTDDIYDFLHVRRIQSNFIRYFLESMPLLQSLFKPNQPNLADRIDMILDNFFRGEYRKGVFNNYLTYNQAVQISVRSPNNTGSTVSTQDAQDVLIDLASGDLVIQITYIPTGILKNLFIQLGPDIVTASFGAAATQ